MACNPFTAALLYLLSAAYQSAMNPVPMLLQAEIQTNHFSQVEYRLVAFKMSEYSHTHRCSIPRKSFRRSGRVPRLHPQPRSASPWRTSCCSASLSWSPCFCNPPSPTSRQPGGGLSLGTPAMPPAGVTALGSAGRPASPTPGKQWQPPGKQVQSQGKNCSRETAAEKQVQPQEKHLQYQVKTCSPR